MSPAGGAAPVLSSGWRVHLEAAWGPYLGGPKGGGPIEALMDGSLTVLLAPAPRTLPERWLS